ncbi:serine hydrolase domain-containing protein [Nonomuraea sp. B5E05]|uniref:serine hydrolase domain-containing protein n=1 Tax=Nonomuraea sp. B5E05 TaxID=3153569 RepID=UPI003260D1D7
MNRARKAGLAGLACVMLALGTPAHATEADAAKPDLGDVQKALSELARSPEILGTIGALYVDGEKVDTGTAGTRLLDGEGGRIPADARFRAGSQTKPMIQIVIMQLVGEGRLALDDKLGDLLPVMVEKDLVDRADEITVEQMIHHTSGIPNYFEPGVLDPFDFTTNYSPLEMIGLTRTMPRTGEPGQSYSYSNTNYFLLGLIVEELTERSLAAELERRIFDPVGMERTYLPDKFPGLIKGPHGHGYHPGEQGKPVDVDRLNSSYLWAAGGVISTTDDLSSFARARAGEKLLSKELKEALNAGRPPRDPGQPAPEPPVCEREDGYGVMTGGSFGFRSMTYSSRDSRVQFVLSNTLSADHGDPAIDPLIKKAAEAVLCPAK